MCYKSYILVLSSPWVHVQQTSDGGGVCYSSFVFTFLLSWLKIRNKQQRHNMLNLHISSLLFCFSCPYVNKYLADRSQSVIRCDSQHCFHVGRDLTLFCISLFVNCSYNVIIQGKGFPDVNTRMMVRCLWSTLQIPILALVDADPHGNLSRFAFFTLDGGVAMSPPKYKSLLIINELILSFLPLWSMTAVYKFLSQ